MRKNLTQHVELLSKDMVSESKSLTTCLNHYTKHVILAKNLQIMSEASAQGMKIEKKLSQHAIAR